MPVPQQVGPPLSLVTGLQSVPEPTWEKEKPDSHSWPLTCTHTNTGVPPTTKKVDTNIIHFKGS